MKDTNAIEKALLEKVSEELDLISDEMMKGIGRLENKYGRNSFYALRNNLEDYKQEIKHCETRQLKRIFKRMLAEAFQEKMLRKKTEELLAKLEL